MSLTPTTPNLGNLKSFWDRPEGKTGMVVTGAAALAGLYGLYLILPFLITLVSNTLYLAVLGTVLFAFFYIITNSRFQNLVKYMFMSLMRALTGVFIELDPVGILKNYVYEMRKQQQTLDEQIGKVNGALQQLRENIKANSTKAAHEIELVKEAQRQQQGCKDPVKMQELAYAVQEHAAEAGRLTNINKDLSALEAQLQRMYELLGRWSAGTKHYIRDRENQINAIIMKRKAVSSAYNAMRSAKAILAGNADSNALYDQTLESIADDVGNKLGDIEDFSRLAQEVLSTIDLENGAAAQEALQQLETYERKVLPSATGAPVFVNAIPVDTPELEPVPANKQAQASYDKMLE